MQAEEEQEGILGSSLVEAIAKPNSGSRLSTPDVLRA